MSREVKKAVVLLSGGLDSATTLAVASRRDEYICHAISFDYGQRHRFELQAAAAVAKDLGATEHRVVRIDLSAEGGFGRSALTDRIEVPKDSAGGGEIPVTYVPARNTIFLSIALGYAEVIGAYDIFIGVNAVDYSGYPDCRGEFIEAFEKMANLATAAAVEGRGRFRVHAPLIDLTKAQIIRLGLELGVDYSLTHSCYDPSPGGLACGHCDSCRLSAAIADARNAARGHEALIVSCRLRIEGFAAAGAKDPASYVG